MRKSKANFFLVFVGFIFIFISSISIIVSSKGKILGLMDGEVEIILTGDIMLGRSVLIKSDSVKNPNYPFLEVASVLKKADVVFANLEAPFVEDCPRTDSGMIFCSDPKLAAGLNYAGINLVTIANNHSKNYGEKGFDQTKETLQKEGVDYVGDSNLVVKNIKGISFGFLGFDFTSQKPSDSDYKLVSDSSKKVNTLMVSVHWGGEYQDQANSQQKEIAQKLIMLGADVIVGHHPHWIQNSEIIDSKPVFYSLGNFVFDQMWSEQTKKGMAVKLTFKDKTLIKEEKLLLYISVIGQPKFIQ